MTELNEREYQLWLAIFREELHPRLRGKFTKKTRDALDILRIQHSHLTDPQVENLRKAVVKHVGDRKTDKGILDRLHPTKAPQFSRGYNRSDMLHHQTTNGQVAEAMGVLHNPENPGIPSRPIDCGSDVNKAARLLGEGKHVKLSQTREVSTLLDKLAANVAEAKKLGKDAPNYNLCKVSVKGTNLFCANSKGIPRVKMPQLSGKPLPGSRAESKSVNAKGEVDLTGDFKKHLASLGVKMKDETEKAEYLRASQNELNGGKVAGMTSVLDSGKQLPEARLLVSHDNYIVDGHHRWAAQVGHDAADGQLGDVSMPITRTSMGIIELLAAANQFAADWGLPQRGVGDRVAA